ncbi:DUF4129 domain-containing protein [Thermococcus sp.]
MNREKYALLLLSMIFLATLTLGYSAIGYIGEDNKTHNLFTLMESNGSEKPRNYTNSPLKPINGTPQPSGNIESPTVPTSNFTFTPTNENISCPVAILPYDPRLVCIDRPAKSVPILSWDLPKRFKMVVWYSGIYYLPYVSNHSAPVPIKGINGPLNFSIDTQNPIIVTTYFHSLEFNVSTNFSGFINFSSAIPLNLTDINKRDGKHVYTFRILVTNKSYTPGYYPLFIYTFDEHRVALLMWITLLEKPSVTITSYPTVLSGNGRLSMQITGRVIFPNGTPVSDGIITITINRTKNSPGIIVGKGRVHEGVFNVTAYVPKDEPPREYHIIAHYSGYLAYPANSDPTVIIKRIPEVKVDLVNGTPRLFFNWDGIALANRTLTIKMGDKIVSVTTDEHGYVYLPATNKTNIKVIYPGDQYYLPVNETVTLPVKSPLKSSGKTALGQGSNSDYLKWIIILGLTLLVGAVYVAKYRKPQSNHIKKNLHPPKITTKSLKFIAPKRRVFLPDEEIEIILNRPEKVFIDGKPVGDGSRFKLKLKEGRHVLSAGELKMDVHVLPARDAIIKAYTEHFLPFVEAAGVTTSKLTPFELSRVLSKNGLNPDAITTVTRLFVVADYGEKRVSPKEFQEFVKALKTLGVFESEQE